MTEENTKKQTAHAQQTKASPTKSDKAVEKEQRVAQALRDNLRRRKQQKKQDTT